MDPSLTAGDIAAVKKDKNGDEYCFVDSDGGESVFVPPAVFANVRGGLLEPGVKLFMRVRRSDRDGKKRLLALYASRTPLSASRDVARPIKPSSARGGCRSAAAWEPWQVGSNQQAHQKAHADAISRAAQEERERVERRAEQEKEKLEQEKEELRGEVERAQAQADAERLRAETLANVLSDDQHGSVQLNDDRWVAFSDEISKDLNACLEAGDIMHEFERGGIPYVADLSRMIQCRDDGKYTTVRSIRRRVVEVPASHTSKWSQLFEGCSTEEEVRQLFVRRQPHLAGHQPLQIDKIVKVENAESLAAYTKADAFDQDPMNVLRRATTSAQQSGLFSAYNLSRLFGAHTGGGWPTDTLLFHGCPEVAATNIQAEGLKMNFAKSGMLGQGLYGAPDPRKSVKYCKNSQNGNFLFLCRFNLSHAKHAGPQTAHRNTVFDEFRVSNERHVVVLWMIKLK